MYRAARPLLFRLPAERAHEATLRSLAFVARHGVLRDATARRYRLRNDRLRVRAFGLDFPSPLGLAAGMDKDARALPAWPALGFGHVELGTVTARPQPGNPRPRMFRLRADRAIVNRMGFSSEGAEAVGRRLASWRERGAWPDVPVGVNLGKTADVPLERASEDYLSSLGVLADRADYLVVNVSSPNTPGLRDLQDEERLAGLLDAVVGAAAGTPVLVKLAPDLSDRALAASAALAERSGAAGLVAVNTTVSRAGLRVDPRERGGLSGAPLAPRARSALAVLRAVTSLPIVSVGGIASAQEAIHRLEAGADLLQLYTGLVYEGPGLARRILDGILSEMERRGLDNASGFRRVAAVPPPAAAPAGAHVSRPGSASPPSSATR